MRDMPLVFACVTHLPAEVQLSTSGRLLQGHQDELRWFEPSVVRIEDPQTVAAAVGRIKLGRCSRRPPDFTLKQIGVKQPSAFRQ